MSMKILWRDTAPEAAGYAPLDASASADVVVIGGGLTGVSTALHIAQSGASVILLEADIVGGNASGRNGGQVVPGFKVPVSTIERKYGRDTAKKMAHLGYSTADYVFSLIDRLRIDCSPTRNGWIQTAFSEASRERLKALVKDMANSGADVEFLDRDAIYAATGSRYFNGGLLERGAGAVHPLQLVRGIASNAEALGARLHERSRVDTLTPEGSRWHVGSNGHRVLARSVVIATDAYTGSWLGKLERAMVTVTSAQLATEPLPPALLQQILPRRAGISDARKLTHYCRIAPDGRFLIGGRSSFKDQITTRTIRRLRRAAVARYPELEGTPWSHAWLGRVSLTPDDVPHVSQLQSGLWTAYGYGGKGVALAVRLGAVLARAACGEPPASLDYPVTPVTPLPFSRLRRPAAAAAIGWYIAREALGFPG
jgi:glycine/D-amino acid oxidase-like deaminating enzyme